MMNNKQTELMAQEHDLSQTGAVMEDAAAETVAGYKKIENGVVSGYQKIEDGVVGGYKKIENGVVSGFQKVVDACVKTLFAKKGESVEDAKARLSGSRKV